MSVKLNTPHQSTMDSNVDPTLFSGDEPPSSSSSINADDSVATITLSKIDKKPSRSANYNDLEDIQLCKSWIEVSEDPLTGTDQTNSTFWARVLQSYQQGTSHTQRTAVSLKSRWGALQHSVNKFSGCVQQIQRMNQSGVTAHDQLSKATNLYSELYKKPFVNMSAYNILSKAPKWNHHMQDLEKTSFKRKKPKDESQEPLASSTPVESDTSRPTGQKRMKMLIAESKANKCKSTIETQKRIAESTEKQSKALAEQSAALKTIAEDVIMSKDIEKLDGRQRDYYKMKQEIILKQTRDDLSRLRNGEGTKEI
ncbi:hypothetical protein O181_011465 [Austropuccinia psidii MF-1]|uniref:No apical meristem-associated C-terminal domain-containing protein n=1 Tax=Austropuccinia psidii MF-1 TaxID=1389203 RepID=A0A9Q3BVY6_9BASI|nr:hypothetical protein [Austropuccinia psidii MF-1]